MKKALALFAASFLLLSANHAQTGSKSTDTTMGSHKTMKKSMHKATRRMDSTTSGTGTMTPLQTPGQMPTTNPSQTPTTNPSQMPSPTQTPNPTQTPSPSQTPAPTPTPSPNK